MVDTLGIIDVVETPAFCLNGRPRPHFPVIWFSLWITRKGDTDWWAITSTRVRALKSCEYARPASDSDKKHSDCVFYLGTMKYLGHWMPAVRINSKCRWKASCLSERKQVLLWQVLLNDMLELSRLLLVKGFDKFGLFLSGVPSELLGKWFISMMRAYCWDTWKRLYGLPFRPLSLSPKTTLDPEPRSGVSNSFTYLRYTWSHRVFLSGMLRL